MQYGPVEQARAWVRTAYEEQPGTPGSVMEIFSGKSKDQGQTVKGASQVGFSPTRIHAAESTSAKGSRIPVSSGCNREIKQAIARLPGIYKNWIVYCYNPSYAAKLDHGDQYRKRLWDTFAAEYSQDGLNMKTRTVITLMFGLQVGRAKTYAGYCQWSPHRPHNFANMLTKKQWKDTYRIHWVSLRTLMDLIDQEALKKVYHSAS